MSELNEKDNVNKTNDNKKGILSAAKNLGGRAVFIILVIIAVAAIAFMIYKRITFKKVEDFNAVPSVNVTHIRKGSIDKEVSVMGNILPTDTYYVVAKVSGDIKNIYVKNGDYVKKGDPICEIDASKEIEAAFIQYDTARSSFERMQKLYQAGDISLQSFESVKAQYEGYKLAYDTKVEYSTPIAVDDGVVENTNMTINTAINQGTVLCYITSEGAKEINFGVTERVLSGLKLNDSVKIEKSGKIYDGYISNISNLISAQTGLFNVKAVITSENNFASGVMAKVSFPYIKKKNVNLLPNEMIYYEASMPYVFIVDSENVVRKKYIEVGIENEDYTEIITNLDKSLKIVSTWNNDLAEGATVNIVKDENVEDVIEIESISNEIIAEKNNEKVDVASASEVQESNKVENESSEKDVKSVIEETTAKEEETKIVETTKAETETSSAIAESSITFEMPTTASPFAERSIDSNSVRITEVK